MKTFTLILTIILIFTTVMCVYGATSNDDTHVYSPVYHLEVIIDAFKELPSFEMITYYTKSEAFVVPIEKAWRFQPFGENFTINGVQTGYYMVVPNAIRGQNWVGFEWLNEPIGAVVAFIVRANGVTLFFTDWITAFFENADVLFPTAGLVERGQT